MVKLDIKEACHSVQIHQTDQSLFKFHFNGTLYQYNALPNEYTEDTRKFMNF